MNNFPTLESCLFRVMENQFRMAEVVGECDWQADMSSETLSFPNERGRVVATVPIQIVGSQANGTWLWSWANEASGFAPSLIKAASLLRDSAEKESVWANSVEFPLPHGDFGTEAAIYCAAISNSFGFYRGPLNHKDDAAFLLIESFPEAEKLPDNPMRTIKAITTAISGFTVDHRKAIEAFLGSPNEAGVFSGKGIEVTLDGTGRIASMTATMGGSSEQPSSPFHRIKKMLGR
jgi:hypothetical protein